MCVCYMSNHVTTKYSYDEAKQIKVSKYPDKKIDVYDKDQYLGSIELSYLHYRIQFRVFK